MDKIPKLCKQHLGVRGESDRVESEAIYELKEVEKDEESIELSFHEDLDNQLQDQDG